MKRKITISSIISLILLICVFTINRYHNNPVMGGKDSEIISVPADFENVLSYKGLIDDSFIYLSVNEGAATYYRHYINDNKIITLGTIDNFLLSTKNTVLIDNVLYFYASVIESDTEDTSNILFGIDLSRNKMNTYKNDDEALAGILTYQFDEDIITLKNIVDDGIVTTYLDVFDINSKSWRQENINVVNQETHEGSAIFGLYGNKESVYVLHDDWSGGKGNIKTTLKVYDTEMNEVQTVNLDNDLRDYILSSRIQEIAIFGEYIYIYNTSNNGLLGKIVENNIEPIIKERNLELSMNQTSTNNPLFYVRRSNKCYLLDEETGNIDTLNLKIGNGYYIRCILTDEVNVLLVCSSEDKNDYMYYFKKDILGNISIPCE